MTDIYWAIGSIIALMVLMRLAWYFTKSYIITTFASFVSVEMFWFHMIYTYNEVYYWFVAIIFVPGMYFFGLSLIAHSIKNEDNSN